MSEAELSAPTVRNISLELRELGELGFSSTFGVRPGGKVLCEACHHLHDARELEVVDFRRVEGQSDPADSAAVVAARCSVCGARGVLVVTYGAAASSEDSDVLAGLNMAGWSRNHGVAPPRDTSQRGTD